MVRNLLLDNTISEESKETKYQQDGSCNPKSTSTVLTEVTSSSSSNHHSTAEQGQLESDTSVPQLGQDERPQFYKKDFICILEEKNQWKEKADQLQEELEEWKWYNDLHIYNNNNYYYCILRWTVFELFTLFSETSSFGISFVCIPVLLFFR